MVLPTGTTFLFRIIFLVPGRVSLHTFHVADHDGFDSLAVGPGDELTAHLVYYLPLLVVRLTAGTSNSTGIFFPLPAIFSAPAALLVQFFEFLVAKPFDAA